MAENKEREAQTKPQPGEMSEEEIDRNLAETFPASDPPSWTLGTDHREDPIPEQNDLHEDVKRSKGHESKT